MDMLRRLINYRIIIIAKVKAAYRVISNSDCISQCHVGKMEKLIWMLLMVLTLVSIFHSSQAVTCHLCTSALSSDCGDPFKSSTFTCEGNVCTKTQYTVKGWLVIQLLSCLCEFNNSISSFAIYLPNK